MAAAVDRDQQRVGRAHDGPEQRAGVGHFSQAALQALVERPHHAGVEAGAHHQQKRLAVGLRAGDPGDRPLEQHARDRRRGAREADLVGEHIAGADRDDAEWHVRADQARRRVPDGAVAAGGDDDVIAAALGGLAHREPSGRNVGASRTRDRSAAFREQAHHLLDQRRAGDAGPGIFHDKKTLAHARSRLANPRGDYGI